MSPRVAAALDQCRVGRRYEDQRNQSDMLRQPLIFLFISFEMLFHAALHPAINAFLIAVVSQIETFEYEKVGSVGNELRVDRVECAATEREIIHCIEEVCLSFAVVSDQTIHLG